MEHEMDLFPPAAFGDKVKNKSVQRVFSETPDEHTQNEQGKNIIKADAGYDRFIEHVGYNGKVKYCRYGGVDV